MFNYFYQVGFRQIVFNQIDCKQIDTVSAASASTRTTLNKTELDLHVLTQSLPSASNSSPLGHSLSLLL